MTPDPAMLSILEAAIAAPHGLAVSSPDTEHLRRHLRAAIAANEAFSSLLFITGPKDELWVVQSHMVETSLGSANKSHNSA